MKVGISGFGGEKKEKGESRKQKMEGRRRKLSEEGRGQAAPVQSGAKGRLKAKC
jgi:hypothetical protein